MNNIQSLNFIERFSPKNLAGFILPKRIKDVFQNEDNPLTQSILFYGLQGSGKSSLAKYLGKKYIFLYVNASVNGKIDYLRDTVTEFCENYQIPTDDSINTDKKVVLFDEINGASDSFFEGLKGFMDSYPNVIFLATTNHFNKIPDPIKSRMLCVDFTTQNKEEEKVVLHGYKTRITAIINKLGLECDDNAFQMIIDKCYPDFRKTLNYLQSIEKSGIKKIDSASLNVFEHRFKDVYDIIIKGDLSKPENIHKILTQEYINSAYELLVSLDNEFINYLAETNHKLLVNIPKICITVAESLNMMNNSVDQGIVLKACIFKLMMIMK